MRYEIVGDSYAPIVKINLNAGEKVKIERGAMVYKRDVELVGKMNSKSSGLGGVLSAMGRSLVSGESFFITEAVGQFANSELGVAPSNIGKIHKLEVGKEQYRLNTGAYLASDDEVFYKMVRQSVSKAFFGGTGGLFVMETSGKGDILIASFGDIVEMEVTPDKPLTIDNANVLAWSNNLDYRIGVSSGVFGFKTGEGLVNTFTGTGTVFIQSRNIQELARTVARYIPKNTSTSD